MPKQKFELTNDQKNIPKRFLLCNCPSCNKDDGQTAVAAKLCPFCYKVGYCCNQCLNKDLSRHVENECQKNLNTGPAASDKSTSSTTTATTASTSIDMIKSQKSSNRNGVLKLDSVNVNDYLSGSSNSGTDTESEVDIKQQQKKTPSRSNSRSRNNRSKK